MSRASWILALLAGACVTENSLSGQLGSDVYVQAPVDLVDILFVVDDSNSMEEEQAALAGGFGSFIEEIELANSNFHLGVISTSQETTDPERGNLIGDPPYLTAEDDYLAEFQARVGIGTGGSDKEKGLDAASRALSPELLVTANAGFLRSEANLLVVIVTDEDDCSDDGRLDGQDSTQCYNDRGSLVPVNDLVARIQSSKTNGEMVQIASIVGPYDDSCADAFPGYRYVKAALATGGLVGQICDADWNTMLYDLGLNAVGILEQFKLSTSAKVSTLEVSVDDRDVLASATDGWTYDSENWIVTFHGPAIPQRGSTIVMRYEIAPY